MLAYFTFFITFLKKVIVLTNIILLIKYITLKILLIFLLVIVIYVVLKYPVKHKRFSKLSKLRKYRKEYPYKIINKIHLDTPYKKILNVIYICIYIFIFIIGLFLLKSLNINSKIYVSIILDNLINIYLTLSVFDKLYCLILSFLLFVLFLLLISKLKRLFTSPIFATHIYMIQYQWYDNFRYEFRQKASTLQVKSKITQILNKFLEYILIGKTGQIFEWEKGYNNWTTEENDFFFNHKYSKIVGNFINYLGKFFKFFIENLSYILISLSVIYDIIYNDIILEKVFYVYPVCHLYQLWRNLSDFYNVRQFQLDEYLMEYFYKSERLGSYDRQELVKTLGPYIANDFLSDDVLEEKKQLLHKRKNKKTNIFFKYLIIFICINILL